MPMEKSQVSSDGIFTEQEANLINFIMKK